jgi:dipeptidyl aminopeptidase/acylaminoacyl peptidase
VSVIRVALFVSAFVSALAAAGAVGAASDSRPIVFPGTAAGSYVPQLFSVQPSGSDLKQLTTGSNAALDPAVSHGGTRVAFARFGIGIFTMNVDGTKLRRLTTNGRDAYPTWSPDGKTIAFVRPLGPAWRVFVVPSHGGKPRLLKQAPASGRPNWTVKGLLIPTAADLLRIDPHNGHVLKYYNADLDAIWGLNSVAIAPGVSKLTYVGTREPIPGDMECGDGPCQRYGLFLENLQTKSKKGRLIVKDSGSAAFSADGSRLVYVAAGALVVRSVATGATSTVPLTGATPVAQGPPAWG